MRQLTIAAALLALAACSQPSAPVAPAEAEPTTAQAEPAPGEIVGTATVTDGDSIEIAGTEIRLDGYDTPEEGKRCGDVNVYQRAANELDALIADRTVTCRITDEPDRYGRQVAQCSVGGVDFGDHLVRQGWGRDWPRYSDGMYADEEAEARAASRGIWGMTCPADVWSGRDYSPQ